MSSGSPSLRGSKRGPSSRASGCSGRTIFTARFVARGTVLVAYRSELLMWNTGNHVFGNLFERAPCLLLGCKCFFAAARTTKVSIMIRRMKWKRLPAVACPYCGTKDYRKSRSRSRLEKLLCWLLFTQPVRCDHCLWRYFRLFASKHSYQRRELIGS